MDATRTQYAISNRELVHIYKLPKGMLVDVHGAVNEYAIAALKYEQEFALSCCRCVSWIHASEGLWNWLSCLTVSLQGQEQSNIVHERHSKVHKLLEWLRRDIDLRREVFATRVYGKCIRMTFDRFHWCLRRSWWRLWWGGWRGNSAYCDGVGKLR